MFLGSARRRRAEAPFLESVTGSLRGDEIALDVGAGTGFLSLALAEKLPEGRVVAVDLSDDMLGQLRAEAEQRGLIDRVEIVRVDAASSGLDDESVDLAASVNLLHETADPAAIVREMARVLRPGGRLVIKDFRKTALSSLLRFLHHRDAHGPLGIDEMERLLTQAGLRDVAVVRSGLRLVATATR